MQFNAAKRKSRFVDAHIVNLTLKSEKNPLLDAEAADEMAGRETSLAARQRQALRIKDVLNIFISTSFDLMSSQEHTRLCVDM